MTAALNFKQGLTPMGQLLIATDSSALVYAEFNESPESALEQFRLHHPEQVARNSSDPLLEKAWSAYSNFLNTPEDLSLIPVRMVGTEFQRQVWEALETMPTGSRQTYQQLANSIGQPSAVRAVASACARNSIALRIPCHRILRSDGGLGGYRWGLELKRRLLSSERQLCNLRAAAVAAANSAESD